MQLENNSNGKSVISRQCAIDFPPIRIGNEILLVYYYIIYEVMLKLIIIPGTSGRGTGSKCCTNRSSKKCAGLANSILDYSFDYYIFIK